MALGGFALSSSPQWQHSVHSECGFWECFLLCLHYLKINTVLQREGYTKRFFFLFSKDGQKARAGPGTANVDCMG